MCKPPGKSLAKDLAPGECRVTHRGGEHSRGGDNDDDGNGDDMVVMVMKMVKWW